VNILLIHQAFATPEEPGGTRHYELARHLAGRGHRVTVLAGQVSYLTGKRGRWTGWAIKEGPEQGLEIWRCFSLPGWHHSFLVRTLSFISFSISSLLIGMRFRDIDVVWGTSPPIVQGATALALARLKRAQFVFEVRDLWPAFAVAVGVLRSPILIRASEWLERVLYRNADRVVVNSPGFLEHVKSRGGRSVDLVPNAVDVRMFDLKETGSAYRRAHGLEGRFVVLYAGAHGMSNDLQVVLRAADGLTRYDGIVFVLVGDGKEKPALIGQAEQLGLRNVKFMPPVPKSEMPVVLAAADACVAILKPLDAYKTTYPNKVFDYMAAAKPVLLAIDGAIRQVVEAAGAGIFCAPGSPEDLAKAVLELVFDRRRAEAMGKAGRAYVEAHFDRPHVADMLEKAMLEAVDKANGPRRRRRANAAGEKTR
jgi:glycosyltransferase involved in cell wall biosynthesis